MSPAFSASQHQAPAGAWRRLALLLLGGLVNRLMLLPLGGYTWDLEVFQSWAVRLMTVPRVQFYDTGGLTDHLPGDLWLIWALGRSYKLVWPGAQVDELPLFVFKLIPTVADLGVGVLLFLLARRWGGPARGLLAAGLYLFNPATIFLTAIWGQWDSLSAGLALLALWLLLRRQPELALPVLTYAVLVKPTYALLAPLFGLLYLRQEVLPRLAWSGPGSLPRAIEPLGRPLARGLLGVGLSAAVCYAVLLPFNVGLWPFSARWSLLDRLTTTYQEYPFASFNAFNFWALAGANERPDNLPFWLSLSHEAWGKLLLAGAYLTICLLLWWRRRDPALLWACLAALFAVYLFQTRQHERYLFPVVAFGAVAAALVPLLRWWYVGLSLSYLFNLVWVYDKYFDLFQLQDRGWFGRLVEPAGLVNLGLFLLLLLAGLPALERGAGRSAERPTATGAPLATAPAGGSGRPPEPALEGYSSSL